MATIGIYDYDFMNYSHILPNLECAKLYSYYKKNNDIPVLIKKLEPELYTKVILRRDYNDYKNIKELKKKNVIYGGYSFTNNIYNPLPLEIEKTIPDFSCYKKYFNNFGMTKKDKTIMNTILKGINLRISLDGKTVWNKYESQFILNRKNHVIYVHDFDLNNIDEAPNVLEDLSKRNISNGNKNRNIGTKFPIQLYTIKDFYKWWNISSHFDTFFIQYNGLLEDEILYELVKSNNRIGKILCYNPLAKCYNEENFYNIILPKLFPQILFLRRELTKILLIHDNYYSFLDDSIKKLLILFSSFVASKNFNDTSRGSLYAYVKGYKKHTQWKHNLTIEEIRKSFQKVRKNNYDIFDMFYQWDKVKLQGGKFINDTI